MSVKTPKIKVMFRFTEPK